jgi:hypothetical protein
MKTLQIILGCLILVGVGLYLFAHMNRADASTKERLPEFVLAPTDYGWTGRFPGGPWRIFGKEVSVEIDTRAVPYRPEVLPSVSVSQAELVHKITPALSAILTQVEQAMVKYNNHDADFRQHIAHPQVWLNSEKDDGLTWAFVIERTDNPDFGYHTEFKGTNFIEIWAGD